MANFKTRARALDLLGRQQIAGIPTAINELFKNAHDAYADNVDIDYFRNENLLILRDNGLGMTKDDFETRWLTLGTESKFSNRKISAPPIDKTKPLRPTMGEKGIGRLAIASIGKQVLILTKAKRKNQDHKIVAALINWEIFELPGLNLEDVVIPIHEFDTLPSLEDIESMKNEVIISLKALVKSDDITKEEATTITTTIQSFKISPKDFNNKLVGNFPMDDQNGGTFFYVSPIDNILNHNIDGSKKTKDATKIEKMLIGFHNTMTPNHPNPVLDIIFRDYRGDNDTYTNIIDKEQFFSTEDFELADHHIQGSFDKFGQFKGMVKIYQEKTFDHIVNWNENHFKETNCGSFKINLAYVQGVKKDSIIKGEDYNRISSKADKFGGLYIYKDNIRILPYGDSDYDYLDIEKNRSKRASTAFFSYRRMFGVIDISHNNNNSLKEKAGREGFIENKAYRQLQEILKNFFVQLAADFFRDDKSAGPKAEIWQNKRKELQSAHAALERRDKQARNRKEKFGKAIGQFFINLNQNKFQTAIDHIIEKAKIEFNAIISIKDHEFASQRVIDIESQVRQNVSDFRKTIFIAPPRGFNIAKELRQDYEAYIKELEYIDNSLLLDAYSDIDLEVERIIRKLNIELSKRKRLEEAINSISVEAKKINNKKKNDATDVTADISKRVKVLANELMIDLDNQIRSVKDRFKLLEITGKEDFDLVEKRKELEIEIKQVSDRNTFILDTIIRQLESVSWDRDDNNQIITNDQITDALGEELDEIKERIQTDIELSQLGLAVGVVHHEFSGTIRSIRGSLNDLKAWSDVNEHLESVYSNIKINFEHLDGYLNLFTPLNRRLNRKRENINAIEIKTFLIDLFSTRMERHNIQFKHTKAFRAATLYGFRSTYYPVFVNIIDNAIFWLNDSKQEDKVIRLHADSDGSIFISNNGASISKNDESKIYNLGFTRKENGRGMGLHISKEVLNAENYNIILDTPRKNSSVTFKIEKNKTAANE